MRPVYLSIKGINSFKEKQEINFEDVSGSNIFCIYGPTGAGKTTVLDAIILALYGDGGRGNIIEYINSTEESGEIVFRFVIDDELYEVQKTLNRKGTGKSFLYNLTKDLLVADRTENVKTAISQLLGGLSLKEFTQVVILEQGKFDKFLSSQTTERHRTISQLFSLDKYDGLHTKFNLAAGKFENECKILHAKLEKFADCTKEKKEELESENKMQTEFIFRLKSEAEKLQKSLLASSADKVNFETLIESRADFDAAKTALGAVIVNRSKINDEKQNLAKLQSAVSEARTVLEKTKITLQNISQIKDERIGINLLIDERKKLLLSHAETKDKHKETAEKLEEAKQKSTKLQHEKTVLVKDSEAFCLESKKQEQELFAKIKAAKNEYEAAVNLDMAAHLGASLNKGDACPVCQNLIDKKLSFANCDIDTKKRKYEQQEIELDKFRNAKSIREDSFSADIKRLDAVILELGNDMNKLSASEAALALRVNNILERGVAIKSEISRFLISASKRLGIDDIDTVEKLDSSIAGQESIIAQKSAEAIKLVEKFENDSANIAAKEQSLLIEQKTLESKIAERTVIIEKLKNTKFDAADFAKLESEKIVTEEKLSQSIAKNAECNAALKRIEEGIAERAALTKELKATEKKYDCACELAKLFKANKFLEYIEQEYIERFTLAASERLFALTGGKFSLEYSDTESKSGFYVIDYLRDGEQRRVRTLSGGETFLASLSLAVAISQQISSQKQFDFFFLDEGFGTLDESAIETVSDALYLLAQNTLVGVISHRPELIEKIPSRIKVVPATNESGSIIEIES